MKAQQTGPAVSRKQGDRLAAELERVPVQLCRVTFLTETKEIKESEKYNIMSYDDA